MSERNYCELTAHLHLSCVAQAGGGKGVGNVGVKLSLGRRREGRGVLVFAFVSHHSILVLIVSKIIFPKLSQFCL